MPERPLYTTNTHFGISGDGDAASIGLGQFRRAVRRRLNMAYVFTNSGSYRLTMGRFSATHNMASDNKLDFVESCEEITSTATPGRQPTSPCMTARV